MVAARGARGRLAILLALDVPAYSRPRPAARAVAMTPDARMARQRIAMTRRTPQNLRRLEMVERERTTGPCGKAAFGRHF